MTDDRPCHAPGPILATRRLSRNELATPTHVGGLTLRAIDSKITIVRRVNCVPCLASPQFNFKASDMVRVNKPRVIRGSIDRPDNHCAYRHFGPGTWHGTNSELKYTLETFLRIVDPSRTLLQTNINMAISRWTYRCRQWYCGTMNR